MHPPVMAGRQLWVALPSSLLMEDRDLRDKTLKVGQVARAMGVFCVDRVFIFDDELDNNARDAALIRELLEYMETPQYLRKRLYGLRPSLAYAGLLPPLKLPSHRAMPSPVAGGFREGVVEERSGKKFVFAGMNFALPFEGRAPTGSRVTVRLEPRGDSFAARQTSRAEVPGYWGYTVSRSAGLPDLCTKADLAIATSRLGRPVAEAWGELREDLRGRERCLVAFGAPKRGLHEMLGDEAMTKCFRHVINALPGQGVETIRTEEAIFIFLSLVAFGMNA